jgi:membrane fusion protein
LAQLAAQLAQSEAAGGTVLRAPRAGVVSTLLVKPGQNVTSGQPLLSILPHGSALQAQLLVPSNAIGFVHNGTPVVLRYQAYPYEKFGQQYGQVVQVSRSALSPAEAATLLGQSITTPLYRVMVSLDRQTINAYGKAQALKPGMALNADLLLDRRSLWQWVFEPLYGLRQQLAVHGAHHQ